MVQWELANSGGVSAIAAGGIHSLALKDGKVYAWGSGSAGQLGNGADGMDNQQTAPVEVKNQKRAEEPKITSQLVGFTVVQGARAKLLRWRRKWVMKGR